ncbi:MAG: tRNA (guanosine(37)-N1)-methyltransferase TrmD [Omnitrophica bacterium RIFCSPLOWO2_12_FULL_44_17]|uniref:tRNA (guanine-N(1)-)-methyltransferase n=1 Tax=Candidatus Danuiimicrobium aquiferis TaxID=1801832 RepID=A0A1G1KWT6_9BACT|nr:MAG: tRNA (guanosine(37)-N1)-methyltransferase TrmD [Omnitrophica bacterium RIFCSPHIGHO2_02_FULL_45_28]OGW91050.1 MAG: tRNA (guanosine(37)-N1)-methyltransferase TrmD [Omnitrophica bacterium RIFCSPHIGHO2_12_FULL_44_12]OGW97404.1 MAG: tRNA (guanosine(37)-N1)-methyltransferase TrmD [Omnitrophica bacterium RIFCSPLOWO2_12_FULL_44_17]OGX04478.1 MAG: tRNA (guanosine(37)-N1)-methyltransferase TrmD [Omnitrophica bacterium RIFCSPLOWO2_02_FULL_44_11]
MKRPHLVIDVITLFPKLLEAPLNESMARQAKLRGAVQIRIWNLRDYALDKRRTCDDKPFGGGAGMVMMIQPIDDCLKDIGKKGWRVMVSPRGQKFSYEIAKRLAEKKHLIFMCGHYEGIDERVHEHLIDEEISIGDFVTTGGEFPALCMIDSIMRLVPGVLGNEASLDAESFTHGMLDYPHYTRPREFKGRQVPAVLLSGHHDAIQKWRETKSHELTKKLRPDLLKKKIGGNQYE